MNAPLSDDIALRVGLAARALKQVDAKVVLKVLLRLLGEPITATKLERLRPRRLKQMLVNKIPDLEATDFNEAVNFLKGHKIQQLTCPAPNIPPDVSCALFGSVRVVCASNSGEMVDGNFSSCIRYLVYQVSATDMQLIDIREPKRLLNKSVSKQETNLLRAKLISDCDVLYTHNMGAMAAAKVVKMGVHPITFNEPAQAQQALKRLQEVLAQDSPPPWLVKAMNQESLHVNING